MFGVAFCPRGSWPINDEIHTFRISGCQHLRGRSSYFKFNSRFGKGNEIHDNVTMKTVLYFRN